MTVIACFCGEVYTPLFGPPVCPKCGSGGELDTADDGGTEREA